MNKPTQDLLRVLLIEDNRDHAEIIQDAFQRIDDMPTKIDIAFTITDGIAILDSNNIDICFTDLNLPDSDVSETIKLLTEHKFAAPIVILSSLHNTSIAKQLLNQGIQDYLPKSEITPALLSRTCRYAIERWRHLDAVEEHNNVMRAFCSSLSHDFNSNIARIVGLTEMLEDSLSSRVGLCAEEKKWFEHLFSCSSETYQLVSDLRSYLSVEEHSLDMDTVNLNEVITRANATLKKATKARFSLETPPTMPSIGGYHELLHLMFLNLLSNAIKFNNNTPRIKISAHEDENTVSILIQDNGIGFDESKSKAIFAPFERLTNERNYVGSGLGLSIVKRIVDHHNGKISATSRIGEGSCFTLNFDKICVRRSLLT